MIIDAHAHVSDYEYGNVDTLLTQMKESKIDKAVLVPGGMLDIIKMTKYITGEEQPNGTYIPNDLIETLINQYPDKFYGYYCVNPHLGDSTLGELRDAVKRGFSILKLAPMVHQFSLTSNTVLRLVDLCGELDIPLYTHVVYSPAASTKKVIQLAKMFPKTNIILGHMGFGPADKYAVDEGYDLDNLYFETSQGSYQIIKQAYKKLGASRIIYGSEFPMYHPLSGLQNIFALGCTDSELDSILGKNILDIMKKK